MLNTIQRGKQRMPPRLLVYGTEGVGKSTFASGAPAPIFIQTEDGLGEIDCDKFPLATSLDDVHQQVAALCEDQHDYQTVVIDSADWLERLIHADLCRKSNVESIDLVSGGYGKGYTMAANVWSDILAGLDYLRKNRGMVCILVAHAKIEKFEDPESPSYDRYSPKLHKASNSLVCEWADATMFATRRVRVSEQKDGAKKRNIAAPIGANGGDRVLRAIGGPSCVAKNRYGIVEEIPLSWSAFVSAMSTPATSTGV